MLFGMVWGSEDGSKRCVFSTTTTTTSLSFAPTDDDRRETLPLDEQYVGILILLLPGLHPKQLYSDSLRTSVRSPPVLPLESFSSRRSNPRRIIDWTVKWTEQVIKGSVTHRMKVLETGVVSLRQGYELELLGH